VFIRVHLSFIHPVIDFSSAERTMLKKIEDMNFYELLEVSPRATAQEIHKAYERIRKIYDPNSIALYSLFSPEETEKIRTRIEEAYRTLVYDENRRVYDLNLRDYREAPEPDRLPPQPSAAPAAAVPRQEPPRPQVAEPSSAEPRAVPHAPPTPSVPAVPQPVPADLRDLSGSILRMLREQRNLSIQNVADITKLGTRYLEAIEAENYPKLPARPYLRGFLALYAKAMGYEPERIVNEYMKRYEAAIAPPKK
jgi:curved DNA-binding protein CbpA